MNLPLTAIAAVLVVFFLKLKVPSGNFKENLKKLDWTYVFRSGLLMLVLMLHPRGNALVVAATTSCAIALTWAGVQHPWSSWQVLVPLILGLVGFVIFFTYEAKIAGQPVVPWELVNKRSSLSG